MNRAKAEAIVAAIKTVQEWADDKLVSQAPALCKTLHGDGALIRGGTRICWNGAVLRATSDLWDRGDQWPDAAPTLWEEIEYRDGVRIIPQTITVGKAFAKGEKGWWGDTIYVSKVNANVYTPEQYPRNWEKST